MTAGKRFFISLLPLLLAVLIVFVCLAAPAGISEPRLRTASASMGTTVLSSSIIKQQAMSDERYIPFFGSSELRRFNITHPSLLAKKYGRSYTPFLLGTKGTQSLTHFLFIQSMGESVRGKRAVFIISPQWFQKKGIDEAALAQFCSPLGNFDYVSDTAAPDAERKYFARRMLGFDYMQHDAVLKSAFEAMADGAAADPVTTQRGRANLRLLTMEDKLFSRFFIENHNNTIDSRLSSMPDKYDKVRLTELAKKIGQRHTSNNKFYINNNFYRWRIRPELKHWKGRQKKLKYDKSPEYGDFQLVLSQMASKDMDVLFVIPPVNEAWTAYTGLDPVMYQRFVSKIKLQLESQGFTRILDLSKRGSEPYFMQDTIHLGWLGWLAMDEAVQPFLEADKLPKPEYSIDPYYYSKEWCDRVITPAEAEK
ncbi:MAG: D-alanyl-lipoteichoic acid biosynthesis protein DltD [Clostridiales Family XIII bacterium]|jgi:D-alanine transfer protein|nr:D-alanyl-lipoteichoic acid biosynthesis protein DltD [Clostridiales Family XIII bacterium]